MAYDHALDALGDPTRRAILERLRSGPRPVGELARELPVSRPAVSQHLRVLATAGLVRVHPVGTRRIYSLEPAGFAELRRAIDRFWDDALAAFKLAAERRDTMTAGTPTLEPVRKTVTVACSLEQAFRVFTEEIATWWPTHSHSVGGDAVATVVFEDHADGRLYERQKDGKEAVWGEIVEWEPPHRLALLWHPARDASEATRVEVRFSADGDATRVELEHFGWEARGDEAAAVRASYESGWDSVLARYTGSISR